MKNIIKALNEVMKSVSYVQKSSENKFHGYKYASESSLLESLRPAMIDQGLVLIPSIGNVSPIDANGNTTVTVEYTLAHTSGEIWPDKIIAVGCGNDKSKSGSVGDKGIYKALTGANKYLLFKLFQIETGDDPEKEDGDKSAPIQEAAKPAAKKESAKKIDLPKGSLESKDVDNYVKLFTSIIEMCKDEKEVRAFWSSENDNRIKLAIMPNNTEYSAMSKSCATRINAIKEDKNV
jgi:hypothetical protein